jgi:hypothetical protein
MKGRDRTLRTNLRLTAVALIAALAVPGCRKDESPPPGAAASTPPAWAATGEDAQVTRLGSIEVTARLVEVPQGAIFRRELYDYATILKYEVLQTHRGQTHAKVIYVGQYNPFKPRNEATDRKVKGIGGTVQSFTGGAVHRMALESTLEDHFMGGIVNKYFGQETGPLYWALWTNSAGT